MNPRMVDDYAKRIVDLMQWLNEEDERRVIEAVNERLQRRHEYRRDRNDL
jgi:hypothetical protein